MMKVCLNWKYRSARNLLLVLSLLAFTSAAHADPITSFETGDLDGWTSEELNGMPLTTVNSNRASNGTYSAESSFVVPAAWAGWGVHSLLSEDTADIGITSSTTQISLDAYSSWSNPNGWGVYGNDLRLIVNYENGWEAIAPSSGALTNGVFTPFTFDISAHAAAMSAPNLVYSQVLVAWFLGTWADNGQDNGVHTISIDNIQGNNLSVVPEPSSFVLLTLSGLALYGFRRRSQQ